MSAKSATLTENIGVALIHIYGGVGMRKTADISGAQYIIQEKSENDNELLRGRDAYCDRNTRKIVIGHEIYSTAGAMGACIIRCFDRRAKTSLNSCFSNQEGVSVCAQCFFRALAFSRSYILLISSALSHTSPGLGPTLAKGFVVGVRFWAKATLPPE